VHPPEQRSWVGDELEDRDTQSAIERAGGKGVGVVEIRLLVDHTRVLGPRPLQHA
jgi:hypothetical protein